MLHVSLSVSASVLYVSTISPVSVSGFSSNLLSFELIRFWGQKVKGQGHIMAEASSSRLMTLMSSEAF